MKRRPGQIRFFLLGILFSLIAIPAISRQAITKDPIDEKIKSGLVKRLKTDNSKLICDTVDQQFLRKGSIDYRTNSLLKELTKRHRLAVRIYSGYESNRQMSRETPPNFPSISAHFDGLAFDIFYADGIDLGWQIGSNIQNQKKARDKIHQILNEIYSLSRRNRNLRPTQMFVYRFEDAVVFAKDLNELYGPPEGRGLMGLGYGPYFWDRIHVGY